MLGEQAIERNGVVVTARKCFPRANPRQIEIEDKADRRAGARVVVMKMPLPALFRQKLQDEDAFNAALSRAMAPRGVRVHDFSAALPDARFYFDSDHLNHPGMEAFFAGHLKAVLESGP